MHKYLVISDNKDFWPKEGQLLFLGNWCQKQNLSDEDTHFEIVNPNKTFDQADDVVDYANNLFEVLLKELKVELNKFHNVQHSERYWNIIVGPWLTRHIRDTVNRYITLNNVISNYKFDKVVIPSYADKTFGCLTYGDYAERRRHDSTWNDVIYADMLKHWPKLNAILINKKSEKTDVSIRKADTQGSLSPKVKKILIKISGFINFFKRDTDAVVTNTYLSIFQEAILQLSLWQVPQLWTSPKVKSVDYSEKTRKYFFQNHTDYQGCDLEVRRLIHKLIPICYLEGYKSLSIQVNSLNWPLHPKFIYTSNRFGVDEIFKLWVAEKVNTGTPYYVGQHGNGYGTARSEQKFTEINSCDKFFSWGWHDNDYANTEIVPAFIFKKSHKKSTNYDKKGGLLLVGAPSGLLHRWNDYFSKIFTYHKYALRFFDALSMKLKLATTVRLYDIYNLPDRHVWESNQSGVAIKFSRPNTNIYELIKESRIVVHTYDSTGILENLSLNVPMICYWEDCFDGLFPAAVPYYKLLADAGILHDSPESAAHHIEENWDNIDNWWNSEEVCRAKDEFCRKYAKKVNRPVATLRELLLHS